MFHYDCSGQGNEGPGDCSGQGNEGQSQSACQEEWQAHESGTADPAAAQDRGDYNNHRK